MDKAEAVKVAEKIAAAIGETGDRPRAQIARIVMLAGDGWVGQVLADVFAAWERNDGDERKMFKREDGTIAWRTLGGFFFEVARCRARERVEAGALERRDFFRCFYDRAPEPKQPKTRPHTKGVRPGGKKARRDTTHNWGPPRTHGRRAVPQPEIYTVRRAAR